MFGWKSEFGIRPYSSAPDARFAKMSAVFNIDHINPQALMGIRSSLFFSGWEKNGFLAVLTHIVGWLADRVRRDGCMACPRAYVPP